MKNGKSKFIKIIGLIIVLLILVFFVWILAIRPMIAKKCVESTLNCICNDNYNSEFYYADYSGIISDNLKLSEMGKFIINESEYEITDINIKPFDMHGLVTIDISYPDVTLTYDEKFNNASKLYTSEEIDDYIISKLNNKNYNVVQKTIEIEIVENGTKWYVMEDDNLLNWYTGEMWNYAIENLK